MENIRNIQGKNALLHVLLREPFSYFSPLLFVHNYNSVSPRKLFSGNRPFIVEPCRFSLKFAFKYIFSCFASVQVLITNKKYLHNLRYEHLDNINFTEINKDFEKIRNSKNR